MARRCRTGWHSRQAEQSKRWSAPPPATAPVNTTVIALSSSSIASAASITSHTPLAMSRRAAVVEEEFDDDTDLPLPNKPLPNTGTRGALLEELEDSEDEDAPTLLEPTAGPASPSLPQFRPAGGDGKTVTDITPYKKYVRTSHSFSEESLCTGRRRLELASAGGPASTPSTSTRSGPVDAGNDGFRARRACGGRSARISPTRPIVSVLELFMK